ncbi:MAG: LptF/LptG family permease [Methylocystis sp.]|nr:LptF/LptG family permease [Methylocystis sp.]
MRAPRLKTPVPPLLFHYLFKRIGVGVVIVQLALSVPVVLSYLLYQLPPAAVRGGLIIPALVGVTPTVAFITLPMAIGVATALEFARMASEGMIAVLYALRLSVWSICRPALALAVGVTALSYVLANFIAPHYAANMQDVLNVIRNSLNHRMLDAARFYTFDNGVKTLYIERWITPDLAGNLFVRQVIIDKMKEETITAARAEFRRNESGVIVALSNGSIQTRSLTSGEVRIANFDEYAMALPMQGSGPLPNRGWRGVYELSPSEFFLFRSLAAADPRQMGEWWAEAAKRFGVPTLTLAHTLLAMALVLTYGNITGRRGAAGGLIILALPAVHIAFLVALESLLRVSGAFIWLLISGVALETGASVWLLAKQNFGPAPKPYRAQPTQRAGASAV